MAVPFPVVIWKLQKEDEGYPQGARYRVNDVDGGEFFFRRLMDAKAFLKIHGMVQVGHEDMLRLRHALRRHRGRDERQ